MSVVSSCQASGRALATRPGATSSIRGGRLTARHIAVQQKPRLVCAAAAQKGVALVHMYEDLRKPALFESFLEGMTHVVEVGRHHPDFRLANIHTCLDQEALDNGAAFSYLNFSVFGDDKGVSSLDELAAAHGDWLTSMEFGHDGQVHHPILAREADSLLNGPDKTPVQEAVDGDDRSCKIDDVVVVVAADSTKTSDSWKSWSGAEQLAARDDFRSATLYEAVESDVKYPLIMRAEFGSLTSTDLDTLADEVQQISEASGESTITVVYRSLVHVEQGGSPVDLLFANRAKEEQEAAE